MDRADGPASGTVTVGTAAAAVGLAVAVGVAVALGAVAFDGGSGSSAADGPANGTSSGPAGGAEAGPAVLAVSGNTTVTVTYTVEGGERATFVAEGVDPGLTDPNAGWAFVDRSKLPPALASATGGHGDGIVPVGDRVLVGNATSATRAVGTATVTVVAPVGRGVDPARKAGFVAAFLSPYALDPEPRDVTVVAAPDALAHDGLMYPDGTGYVTIEAFWDGDVGSVWLHEVVHTRQSFALGDRMGWFREASAEYLAYRAMEEQYGPVTDADVRARLDAVPDYREARLSAPSTWDGDPVDYTKGARVLYAVDAAVRAGSDGEYTLFDVFYDMNRHDGTVSLGDFHRIVERRAGVEAAWIERAVTEPGPIAAVTDAVNGAGTAFGDAESAVSEPGSANRTPGRMSP